MMGEKNGRAPERRKLDYQSDLWSRLSHHDVWMQRTWRRSRDSAAVNINWTVSVTPASSYCAVLYTLTMRLPRWPSLTMRHL